MKSNSVVLMAAVALALALATAASASAAEGKRHGLVDTAADAFVWSTMFQLTTGAITGGSRIVGSLLTAPPRYVGRLFRSLKPTLLQKQLGDEYCPANNPDLSCWFVPSTRLLIITTSSRARDPRNQILTHAQLSKLNALCFSGSNIQCGAGIAPDSHAVAVSSLAGFAKQG